MDWISGEILELVLKLLPGFLSAWIFYGLTAHPRRDAFERVIEAFIFTFIIQVAVVVLRQKILWGTRGYTVGLSDADANLLYSLILAVLFGIILATLANTDALHWLLRLVKITRRTSLPGQWYSAFRRGDRWVVLHLGKGRRLHGWAEEWPDHQESGHFLIQRPVWLLKDGTQVPVLQTYRMIVKGTDVEMVEQVCEPREIKDDSTAIDAAQKPLFDLHKEAHDGKRTAETTSAPAAREAEPVGIGKRIDGAGGSPKGGERRDAGA